MLHNSIYLITLCSVTQSHSHQVFVHFQEHVNLEIFKIVCFCGQLSAIRTQRRPVPRRPVMQVLPLGLVQVGQGVNRLPAISSRRWWHLPQAVMPKVHEGIGRFGHASWHKCWNCCSDSSHLQTQTAAVSLTETWIVSELGWWMQKSMTMPVLPMSDEQPWAN